MLRPIKEINPDSPILSIAVTADILGIHMRTLMLYEYHKILTPFRNPANRRLYSQNDIKKVKFIRYLTRKKKLNFPGVRLVLNMMKECEEKGFDLKSTIFPDFTED